MIATHQPLVQVTRYSIVQSVPDPIANERINVGVIVVGSDATIHVRTLSSWKRVECLVQDDISYIREFMEGLERLSIHAALPAQSSFTDWEPETDINRWLLPYIEEAGNLIQFTALQPSLEEPIELADRLARQYLKEQERSRRVVVDKNAVVHRATGAIRNALASRVGGSKARGIVQTHVVTPGKLSKHLHLDIAVKNGHLYAGCQALSFQTLTYRELEQQASSAILSLNDLRQRDGDVVLNLVVAFPQQGVREFDARRWLLNEVESSCRNIEVSVVDSAGPNDWVQVIASRFAESQLAHLDEGAFSTQ